MRNLWKLYAYLAIYRALNAWIVRTQFDPDESWQTLEPAYCAVFSRSDVLPLSSLARQRDKKGMGRGYYDQDCALTWEWTRSDLDVTDGDEQRTELSWYLRHPIIRSVLLGPIRSYMAVLPTIVFYRCIRFIYKTTNWLNSAVMTILVRKGPAVVHAVLFAASTDLAVYFIAYKAFCNRQGSDDSKAFYSLLASISSWFNGYALVRTYANSIECSLCAVATAMLCSELFQPTLESKERESFIMKKEWKKNIGGSGNDTIIASFAAFFIGGICVAIRFSTVAFWIPLGLFTCQCKAFDENNSRLVTFLWFKYIILYCSYALFGLIVSCYIDNIFYLGNGYNGIVIPFLANYYFNVIEGMNLVIKVKVFILYVFS